MNIYRGNCVFLAILSESGRPRTIRGQYGHDFGSRIGRHCPGSEKRKRGASAERRRPADAGWIRSNAAAQSCLTREGILGECPILVGMSMALVMPGLSDDSQGRNPHDGKLAEHVGMRRPLRIYLISRIAILCLELFIGVIC